MNADKRPEAVRAMFDRIASRYDITNTLVSAGRDGAWRRLAADAASLQHGGSVIDVACGTGLLARELQRRAGVAGRVVGVDFSEGMLASARSRDARIEWVHGDALSLPFDDSIFDAATIAFGLRNLADPSRGLREMRRVVKPGGALVILEFLRPPDTVIGRAFTWYLRTVVSRVGGRLTGDRAAYGYLNATVNEYLSAEELVQLAAASGWRRPRLRRLNAGTVALLVAENSATSP